MELLDAVRQSRGQDLGDVIRRGQSGQLTRKSAREAAAQIGRPTTPRSPLETGVIGAGPDAAKMAGTPAQMRAAIEEVSPRREDDLARVQRLEGPREEVSTDEAAREATSAAMANLGSLQNRVQEATAARLQGLVQLQVGAEVDLEALDDEALADDLEIIVAPDATEQERTEAMARLSGALGIDSVMQDQITVDQLLSFYSDLDPDRLGAIANEFLARQMTFPELLEKGTIGGLSTEVIAQLLGVTEEELEDLALDDFQSLVQDRIDEQTGEVEDLQRILADPSTSASERREVRARLRDLGATGQRTVEAQFQDLRRQIEEADEVTFAGTEWNVKELLEDGAISKVIARYLLVPEGSEWAARLEEEEPDLVAWIEQSREALTEAAARLQTDVESFEELQREVSSLKEEARLDDSTMQDLLGKGWDSIRTDAMDFPPIVAFLREDPAVTEEIRKLQEAGDRKTIRALAALDANQIANLKIGEPKGNWAYWNESRRIAQNLKRASLDKMLRAAGLSGAQVKQAKQDLEMANALRALGFDVKTTLDQRGDGKIDPLKSFRQHISAFGQSSMSLADASAAKLVNPKRVGALGKQMTQALDQVPKGIRGAAERLAGLGMNAKQLTDGGLGIGQLSSFSYEELEGLRKAGLPMQKSIQRKLDHDSRTFFGRSEAHSAMNDAIHEAGQSSRYWQTNHGPRIAEGLRSQAAAIQAMPPGPLRIRLQREHALHVRRYREALQAGAARAKGAVLSKGTFSTSSNRIRHVNLLMAINALQAL